MTEVEAIQALTEAVAHAGKFISGVLGVIAGVLIVLSARNKR